MKRNMTVSVETSSEELELLEELCNREGVTVAEKLNQLMHGFLIAEGVLHLVKSA